MTWLKDYLYLSQYKFVSTNQHGDRFRSVKQKRVTVARLSCERTDTEGMLKLILLSDTLDAPVRYDFKGKQEAYIEIVSAEMLRKSEWLK